MSAAATSTARKKNDGLNPLPLALLPLLILFVAAYVLFWLGRQDIATTAVYWEALVPVVALISIGSGWGQAFAARRNILWYLIKQLIHWGAIIGVLYLLNEQGFRAAMGDQQYAVLLVCLLALGTLLASIQMDSKLFFFALFLGYCAFLLAVPQNNPMLTSVGEFFRIADPQSKPMQVTAALGGAGLAATFLLLLMMRGGIAARHSRENKARRKLEARYAS